MENKIALLMLFEEMGVGLVCEGGTEEERGGRRSRGGDREGRARTPRHLSRSFCNNH